MRKILFHGKRVDNGNWVTGYYLFQRKRKGIFGQQCTEFDHDRHLIYLSSGECYEVDPVTVGEFTGQTDKNSTKIFEGDIVDILAEVDEIGVIKWDENTARFIISADGFDADFDNYYGFELEIIGNIYDNPEMIE